MPNYVFRTLEEASRNFPDPKLRIRTRLWESTETSFPAIINLSNERIMIVYMLKRPESGVNRPVLKIDTDLEDLKKRRLCANKDAAFWLVVPNGMLQIPKTPLVRILKFLKNV